jgi:hypothetical protein
MSKALNFGVWATAAICGVSWFMCLKALGGAVRQDTRVSFVLYVVIFSLANRLPRIFGLKSRWVEIFELVALLCSGLLAGALLAFYEGPSGIIFPILYMSSSIGLFMLVRSRAKQAEGELVA